MLEDARRIVTGHDDAGSSVVVREGLLGKKHGAGDRWIAELWQTDGTTVDRQDEADVVPDTFSLYPPVGGTKFVLVSIAPDDPALTNEELEQRAADVFGGMGAADARVNTQRHPRMHETKTVDYVIVLQGEVTMLLDSDDRDLKAFDVVIQRGTNHAWVCKGNEPALLGAVLIDALLR